jgi:methanogenic corrinoid protein MtbC1
MSALEELATLVENGKRKLVPAAAQACVDEGIDPTTILNTMIGAMDVVGDKFKRNEIFVPEMLIAAKAMKAGVEVIKPLLATAGAPQLGTVIIGTVYGDLHDIGKNLVAMMIESAGFTVVDLGVDVPVQKFLDAYEENEDVKIFAVSALLTTTMPAMEETVAALNAAPFRDKVKVMVGGAPITQEFADKIGADCFTADAASAAAAAKQLVA